MRGAAVKLWHLLAFVVLAWALTGCASYGEMRYTKGRIDTILAVIENDQENARALRTLCKEEVVQMIDTDNTCSRFWAVKRRSP